MSGPLNRSMIGPQVNFVAFVSGSIFHHHAAFYKEGSKINSSRCRTQPESLFLRTTTGSRKQHTAYRAMAAPAPRYYSRAKDACKPCIRAISSVGLSLAFA